jgi:hypothetical protein
MNFALHIQKNEPNPNKIQSDKWRDRSPGSFETKHGHPQWRRQIHGHGMVLLYGDL